MWRGGVVCVCALFLFNCSGSSGSLEAIIAEGDKESVATALSYSRTVEELNSALVKSILSNKPEIAVLLIEAGASPHATTNEGGAVLQLAAFKKQASVVQTLLDKGADPNQLSGGETVLHTAIGRSGNSEVVRLLLEGGSRTSVPNALGVSVAELLAHDSSGKYAEYKPIVASAIVHSRQ